MNFISHNSQGQYTVIIIFHKKQNKPPKGVSRNTDILIHLQLKVIQSSQRDSTTQPCTAISPTSSMELFLRGKTIMNYPPQHYLPPRYKKNSECSVSTAHPCWASYTLVQVHNPTAFELHCFEHCYREHFVSVPLELMLVHTTKFCEWDLVISNRHIVYCIVTL